MSRRSKADVKYAIDLLWTHQVRRENAFLHEEIKRLREEVNSGSSGLDEIRQSALTAQNSADQSTLAIRKVEKIQHTLASTVNDAAKRLDDIAQQSNVLETKLEEVERSGEHSISKLAKTVQQLELKAVATSDEQERRVSSIGREVADVKHQLASIVSDDALYALELRIDGVENELQKLQIPQQSPGIVSDSVEKTRRPDLHQRKTKLREHSGFSVLGHRRTHHLPTFLRSSAEMMPPPKADAQGKNTMTKEALPTVKPARDACESVASDDVDLDENVETMSYAKNIHGGQTTIADDSMPMLQLEQSILPISHSEILELKQGRFYSWDRYFAEGEYLLKRIPREREVSVVKAFMEGLFDGEQRNLCHKWLDLKGWTWKSIASFPKSNSLVTEPRMTSEMTRVPSPAKVHFQEASISDQKQSPQPKASKMKENMSKRPPYSGIDDGGRRRSQRLIEREASQKGLTQESLPAKIQTKETGIVENPPPTVIQVRRTAHRKQPIPSKPDTKRKGPDHPSRSKNAAPKRSTQSQQKRKIPVSVSARQTKAPQKHAIGTNPTKESNNLPVSGQEEMKNQYFSEAPSTPLKGRSPSPFRSIQPVPRLVKRKRDALNDHEQSEDEVLLPKVPSKPVKKMRPGLKRARLPLPPPPAIPILPTSED